MPVSLRLLPIRAPRLWGAWLLLGCAAHAGGAEPASPAPAAPRAIGAAAGIGAPDPLEVVRERLAQRLGVIKPSEKENPNVVRVVSKASSETAAAPGYQDKDGDITVDAKALARKKAAASKPHADKGDNPHVGKAAHPAHWDYSGDGGPEHWGEMKPEFAKCSSGSRQSPIDIRDGIRVELDPVLFDYKPRAFRVVDNGHTIQVNVAPGNFIEVMGQRFDLVQFHFHKPSEERIDGKPFDMVAHLVHKSLEGRLAVVAVLLEKGSAQPVVQSVWNNLPLEKGDEVAARAPIDLNQLLPAERGYFTYMGSLTTPPCSEGVLWMVMKQPVQISPEQLGIFARLYPMNARPIQSASGRLIKESN